MKTSTDPRHIRRAKIMQELFAWDFKKDIPLEYPESAQIMDQITEIDQQITKSAPAWPIEKINKIDLSILRLSIYELGQNQVPQRVVVDEAVELAKEYGSDTSPGFINGVLGKVIG